MYEGFYGLKEKPFNLLPDPEYLYMSEEHENIFTHLEYAIAERKGFVVVTGEIGSGKTTLINYLLGQIPEDMQVGLINNTHIPPTQLIKLICREYELDIEALDKSGMIDRFHDFLIQQFSARKRVVLIVDEAQNLTPKTLEEIRLLSNLEAEKHHLIQIILVGQPELKYKLQRRDLEQFAQRITVHCHLEGLSEPEVDKYIKYRLKIAGSKEPNIFNESAIKAIVKHSRGIPRMINILCDTALVYGYAESLKIINDQIIEDVVKERAAGGIFSNDMENAGGTENLAASRLGAESAFPRGGGNGSSALLDERFQLMGDRIQLMEKRFSDLEQRIETLVNKKQEKDQVVLELFKMLKQSLDSRLETLMKVSALYK